MKRFLVDRPCLMAAAKTAVISISVTSQLSLSERSTSKLLSASTCRKGNTGTPHRKNWQLGDGMTVMMQAAQPAMQAERASTSMSQPHARALRAEHSTIDCPAGWRADVMLDSKSTRGLLLTQPQHRKEVRICRTFNLARGPSIR
jgi:hypothetical protein